MKKFKNLLLVLSVGLGLGMISGVAHTGGFTNEVRRVEAATFTSTITASNLAATETNYTNFTYKDTANGITYVGNSAKNGDNIQLRTTNSNSGIVVTANENGYVAKNVTVVWKGTTNRTLDIYGNTNAYTAPNSNASELYSSTNNKNQGTKLGSLYNAVNNSTTTSFDITDNYSYIGLRSNSGALQLASITITWESSSQTVQDAFAEVKTEASLSFSYKETQGAAISETFTVPTYTANTVLPTYEQDGYSFVFDKGTSNTPTKWWQSDLGYRAYAGNTLTISTPAGGSVESIDFGETNVLYINGSEAVAGTGDVTAYTLSDTNNDGVISLKFNKSTFKKIEIKYSSYASTYSNFNNIKMKFRYEFDPLNYTGTVSEQGFVVSNNSTFSFDSDVYTTAAGDFNLDTWMADASKTVKVVKPDTVTTDSFQLGISVPYSIENFDATFYVAAYIVVDGKYHFAQGINGGLGYSVDSIVDEYLTSDSLTDSQKAVVRAFQASYLA